MCRRNCIYQGGTVKKWNGGETSCNYSSAMEMTNQKYRTRTKQLWVMVEKRHPDWSRQKKQQWVSKHLQGENCPFCDPRAEVKPARAPDPPKEQEEKNRGGGQTKIDEERAKELYRQGLNDAAMGRILEVTHGAVWNWRRRNKLPANGKRGGEAEGKRTYDRAQIRRMLEEGQTVRQIASTLGCVKDTVYRIARAEGVDIRREKGAGA